MSIEHRGLLPLDYDPARYPGSVLRFRGPARDLDSPYVLCLGGSETFGRFVHAPYAAQLDHELPLDVVNMGVMNAGLDVLTRDAAIETAIRGAQAVVLQIPGAQNMSNRFYTVHPRRNDRFIKATTMLRTIYREVDFTEFHFTRHLLTRLKTLSTDRFAVIEAELQAAWVARMQSFLERVAAPVHLLWLSHRRPDTAQARAGLGADPLFVTADMLDRVTPRAASLSIAAAEADSAPSTRGMFFAAGEASAARSLPGPDIHRRAAEQLRQRLA